MTMEAPTTAVKVCQGRRKDESEKGRGWIDDVRVSHFVATWRKGREAQGHNGWGVENNGLFATLTFEFP